jgi:hypothetical protein
MAKKAELKVLKTLPDRHVEDMCAAYRACADMATRYGNNLAGFAVVVWGKDGTISSMLRSDGRIPGILVPDLVRNKLLAERIEDWTIDTINSASG